MLNPEMLTFLQLLTICYFLSSKDAYSTGRHIGYTGISEERADKCGAARHLGELPGDAVGQTLALLITAEVRGRCVSHKSQLRPTGTTSISAPSGMCSCQMGLT